MEYNIFHNIPIEGLAPNSRIARKRRFQKRLRIVLWGIVMVLIILFGLLKFVNWQMHLSDLRHSQFVYQKLSHQI